MTSKNDIIIIIFEETLSIYKNYIVNNIGGQWTTGIDKGRVY